ncbi:hypothetical protein Ae406Ps2_3544c [Pseudonocardia sp. Ae406_Ps2]|nr:hypothetical protein Ae331Ps2_2385 [Pseudonocardia sp. Ae331_Ps2]OLM03544.1 hypothetical protein Ae406Ps2_3544c [Pseudonocardia sp. Ae406_Ps2]OLM11571.1 hypothetical protein Ae505Ps2_1696 [Pseudonocardia sp. Ae505_Ps2]OLM25101.1 hypothetical protein Ae706Ps2_3534c [Pseudonocardia sp. Ae706_Ps2]
MPETLIRRRPTPQARVIGTTHRSIEPMERDRSVC